MVKGRDTMQRNPDSLEEWAQENILQFNKAKHKVLLLGQDIPQHQCRWGDDWFESRPVEKDLGILVDGNLDMRWQCSPEAQKAHHILAYIIIPRVAGLGK